MNLFYYGEYMVKKLFTRMVGISVIGVSAVVSMAAACKYECNKMKVVQIYFKKTTSGYLFQLK